MKAFFVAACVSLPLLASNFLTTSCGRLGYESYGESPGETGRLCLSFGRASGIGTRAGLEIPDTNDFILKIFDSGGKTVYEGAYGDCPESLEVPAGSYTVRIVSCEFLLPAFASPQFGDEQCVVVPSGGTVAVSLSCSQMNAGVTLDVSERFLTDCRGAVLFLKSGSGRLMYSYSERRTAYFAPGLVSLVMSVDGADQTLYSRDLEARDMVKVKVELASAGSSVNGGISMSLDTARVWSNDECIIGGADDSGGIMTVAQARSSIGDEDIWVSGYVVGGDLTSASVRYEPPFKSRTNLLLGPKSSTTDRSACISVQLPDGFVRDAVNLVDNPDLLRKRIVLKGDMSASYFGIPGLKNVSEYELIK